MTRTILIYGLIAGLIVAVPMVAGMVFWPSDEPADHGVLIGYLTMLVALSAVFLGVKHHRDKALGGVIKFLPALGIGLAISLVAGVMYVLGWELALALTGFDYGDLMVRMSVESAQAKGVAGEALEKVRADAEAFAKMYRNPLIRMPITLTEILPVGVLVSLVTAAMLRNSRFMPARIQTP
jgi:hypothetical protein